MKSVTIYPDGACSGNPGPGGWGAILQYGRHQKELSGGEAMTTNNRMELTGVITALETLKEPCVVELWSDSKYVIDALEKGWAKGWQARGWKKPDKKPALNPDLWARLLELCQVHTLHYHWVKGHADNEYNNRCDAMAVAESLKFKATSEEFQDDPSEEGRQADACEDVVIPAQEALKINQKEGSDMGKFKIKETKTGFKFDLLAGNGQVIADSEVYSSLDACKKGVESVRKNCGAHVEDQTVEGFETLTHPKFEVYQDKAGEFRFRLKAKNGEVIATSEGYKGKDSCLNGIESVGKNAPEAPVEIVEE